MRYVLRTIAILAMLLGIAGVLHADPVVMLTPPATPPARTFNFMQINRPDRAIPFNADQQGNVQITFVNGTGIALDCVELKVSPAQPKILMGKDGTKFFLEPNVIIFGTNDFLEFARAGGFPGMTNGQSFTLMITGLTPFAELTVTPTIFGCVNQDGGLVSGPCPAKEPEPATIVLLSTGIAGLAVKMRRSFKRRREG